MARKSFFKFFAGGLFTPRRVRINRSSHLTIPGTPRVTRVTAQVEVAQNSVSPLQTRAINPNPVPNPEIPTHIFFRFFEESFWNPLFDSFYIFVVSGYSRARTLPSIVSGYFRARTSILSLTSGINGIARAGASLNTRVVLTSFGIMLVNAVLGTEANIMQPLGDRILLLVAIQGEVLRIFVRETFQRFYEWAIPIPSEDSLNEVGVIRRIIGSLLFLLENSGLEDVSAIQALLAALRGQISEGAPAPPRISDVVGDGLGSSQENKPSTPDIGKGGVVFITVALAVTRFLTLGVINPLAIVSLSIGAVLFLIDEKEVSVLSIDQEDGTDRETTECVDNGLKEPEITLVNNFQEIVESQEGVNSGSSSLSQVPLETLEPPKSAGDQPLHTSKDVEKSPVVTPSQFNNNCEEPPQIQKSVGINTSPGVVDPTGA